MFNDVEKETLSALPDKRYEIKYQSTARVGQNGHVQLSKDKHYYSVPYQYIRKKVKFLYTSTSVEIYYRYNRIAVHKRSIKPYNYTIDQFMAMLIESEWDDRNNQKTERMLKNVRFHYKASVEEIIYEENRNINQNSIVRLAECKYIN